MESKVPGPIIIWKVQMCGNWERWWVDDTLSMSTGLGFWDWYIHPQFFGFLERGIHHNQLSTWMCQHHAMPRLIISLFVSTKHFASNAFTVMPPLQQILTFFLFLLFFPLAIMSTWLPKCHFFLHNDFLFYINKVFFTFTNISNFFKNFLYLNSLYLIIIQTLILIFCYNWISHVNNIFYLVNIIKY